MNSKDFKILRGTHSQIHTRSNAFLIIMRCIHYVTKGRCGTVISGQNITLSCLLSSSRGGVVWIENTIEEYPALLAVCEAYIECRNNERQVDLRSWAFRNATSSWITVASDIQADYTIACEVDGDILHSFNITFVDATEIESPRCDVSLEDIRSMKVKFECYMNFTHGIEADLIIMGAGKNFEASPNRIYSIVEQDSFIDIHNASCQIAVLGVKRSCAFPSGIRIFKTLSEDYIIFECDAGFESFKDHTRTWQIMNSDMTILDINDYKHNIKSKFPPKEPHQIVQYNKSFKLKPSMGYS